MKGASKKVYPRTECNEVRQETAEYQESHKSDIMDNRQAVPETDVIRISYGRVVCKPNRLIIYTLTTHRGHST